MPKGKKEEKPTTEEKFQQLDINVKDPRTVILMLDSPESGILCKACTCLQQYMDKSEQNCIELHNLGVVPRLVKLINSADKVVYSCAVITLSVLIPHLSVRRSLLKLDCIEPLFKLLKPDEDIYAVERASYIVANLAEEYTFKQRLIEENGCQLLLPLVSHSDCDVIKHSLKALCLLTTHHTARTVIADENGFVPLLAQLDSEYADIQELVLHTMEHCLHEVQCRASFSNSDGIVKITEFLNKQDWNDLHVLAIDVLALSLMENKGIEALHSSNCLKRLLDSINDSQIPQMKMKATRALASASRDIISKKILHEQEAEKIFINLLSSQEEDVCIVACEGLKGLSTLTSSRQYIGREGGIKVLVGLLQHTSVNIRSASVQTLSSVINETIANCNLVIDADGAEALVNLLADESALSRLSAAECIIAMSQSGALRTTLIQNGAMEGLAKCLSHADPKVLTNVTHGIALLAVDSIAREKFPTDSVSTLLQLLLSTNSDVCCNSSWALAVLAQNKTITETVFSTKGAETLQQLSEESLHRGVREYSKLGLKRLLSGSPAAKYSITGVLTPQDTIIETEFWDMGMAGILGFVPLEKIVNQTAEMNKPVIGVSLVNKPLSQQTNVIENEEDLKVKEELDTSVSARSKSRQTQHNIKEKSTGKKSTKDKQTQEQNPSPDEDTNSTQQDVPVSSQGLLPPDNGLWEHVNYIQTNIKTIDSIRNQAERLAVYVSQAMGGQQSLNNPLQYELPLAELQGWSNCPVVPLGEIKKGTYQHRSLLYKILADQLGIPCSLYKGQYGRYWNTIILGEEEVLVDVMFTPSRLLPVKSQEASQYQTV